MPSELQEHRGVFRLDRGNLPLFALMVRDPEQAKRAKALLISSRSLRVEVLVKMGGYATTGDTCARVGIRIGVPSLKESRHAYVATLIAARLITERRVLTEWTIATNDTAALRDAVWLSH